MPGPSRTRRILKWTGVGLSLLSAALWVWSLFRDPINLYRGNTAVFIQDGIIVVSGAERDLSDAAYQGISLTADVFHRDLGFVRPRIAFPSVITHGLAWSVAVPFWLLLLLTAIPTAWLWHRDRRLFS